MKRKRNRALAAGIVIEGLFLCIVLAGFFLPASAPYSMDGGAKFAPPSGKHCFGTDNLGRDVCARTMLGIRHSLFFALCALALSLTAGTTAGLLSAFAPRLAQTAVMRLLDAVNAIPAVLLALVLVSVLGKGNLPLILALAAVFFPSFLRIARNEAAKIGALEYAQSARAQGAGLFRLLFVHILPNMASPLVSASVIVLTNAIMLESALSYLGLGIQPPVPSLGRMMAESQGFLLAAPWAALFPGAAIALMSAGFHYLGDGLLQRRGQ
jgi:peptide/nickel transport system permease protein